MKALLRKIELKLKRSRLQKVLCKILRANETFNPEQYRAEHGFIETDVIITIVLDSD